MFGRPVFECSAFGQLRSGIARCKLLVLFTRVDVDGGFGQGHSGQLGAVRYQGLLRAGFVGQGEQFVEVTPPENRRDADRAAVNGGDQGMQRVRDLSEGIQQAAELRGTDQGLITERGQSAFCASVPGWPASSARIASARAPSTATTGWQSVARTDSAARANRVQPW